MSLVYCAFFEGQGDSVTSPGVLLMAERAKANGIVADVFTYSQYQNGLFALKGRKLAGYKTAAVGYSLGAGTATLLSSQRVQLDLLMALDPSQLGYNYKLNKQFTKRSVLWHDSNWLNGPIGHAGLDLGFDLVHETKDFHLFVDLDPVIQANVLSELLKLKDAP